VIGGAAAARFHRPDSAWGFRNRRSQPSRRPQARIGLKLWEVEEANELLSDRPRNEAYVAARAGAAYALYFTDGGSVGLDLRAAPGQV
jgi:hypothetical protein